jgi:aspartyl-tRNA(Asn)/glutamyl-tRNA(Gln) amidotransferase subunit A
MNIPRFLSIKELHALLAEKKISPLELIEFYRARFAQHDKKIGSALEIFDTDSICKRGTGSGRLANIPGLIKDNICMKGRTMTCASKILENYTAPYTATVIEKLTKEGALFIGRANMDEFAMGSSNETSAYQLTRNPWNFDRVAGGSSGGSAAAVAAGLIPWALGTETSGSVRLPAAFCGLVGSKPTYGLVSRFGVVANTSSLDQVGAMTQTVYDNALLLSVIAGNDPYDATSVQQAKFDFTKDLTGKIRPGLKIGVVENAMNAPGIDPEMSRALAIALEEFKKLGATLIPVSLPTMDYGTAVYFVISRAEAASNLARYDGIRYGVRSKNARTLDEVYSMSRAEGFGEEIKQRILMGNYVLSVGHADQFYQTAKKVQRFMRAEFEQIFTQVDLLFAPTTAGEAFGFNAFADDPQAAIKMQLQDYFTCASNLVSMPAVSVPCGFTNNKLPIGFQLMGPDLSEGLIFQTAYAYEQVTPWHTMHPEGF